MITGKMRDIPTMEFFKHLIDYTKRMLKDQRGEPMSMATALALWLGSIGIGTQVAGTMMGGGQAEETAKMQQEQWEKETALRQEPAKFIPSPEYPEAAGARESMWGKLQEWGQQPGYGAIAPNWQDIWGQAQKRVSDYWRGTATTPGVMDRIKASVAQRGVADSPAYATLATRAGAEEAGQLKDIATTQATQEAQFGETGRQNWLQNMMKLSGMQVQGAWDKYGGMAVTQPSSTIGLSDVIGDVGGGITNLALGYYQNQWTQQQQKQQQNFLLDLIKQGGYGQTTPSTISSGWGTDISNVIKKPDMSWGYGA